jgi:hypothetical protein
MVKCGELLMSERGGAAGMASWIGPSGPHEIKIKLQGQHRLIGATSIFLRARALARFFDAARELASAVVSQLQDVNSDAPRVCVDEVALRHCIFLRQRLEETPLVNEWVQTRRENDVEVEAWNTLLLLLDAHQLAAQSNFGEAVDLLLGGRQMGQNSNPVTYAGFLSSWRFRTFLPVLSFLCVYLMGLALFISGFLLLSCYRVLKLLTECLLQIKNMNHLM